MIKSSKRDMALRLRMVRDMVGAPPNTRIALCASPDVAPRYLGSGWRYETKGGTPIVHPSAYSKHGWSNMVYVYSTLRIELGSAWIKAPRFTFGSMVP